MNKALALGFFQFDNLLRSRVPFALLKSEFDLESFFGVMEKMHLRTCSMALPELTLEVAEAALAERGTRKQDPVVIICESGANSLKLAQALADKDYLNVYYALGGWVGLQEEMKADQA